MHQAHLPEGGASEYQDATETSLLQSQFEAFYLRLERDFDNKLSVLEQRLGSNLERSFLLRCSKLEEKLSMSDRRSSKHEETTERLRAYQEKLERKVKEVIEQNVNIKIVIDGMKTKQQYHER